MQFDRSELVAAQDAWQAPGQLGAGVDAEMLCNAWEAAGAQQHEAEAGCIFWVGLSTRSDLGMKVLVDERPASLS